MTEELAQSRTPRKRGPAAKPGSLASQPPDPGFVVSAARGVLPRGWTVLSDRRALDEDAALVPVRFDWLRKRLGPRGWDLYEYMLTLRNAAGWVWALRSTLARSTGLSVTQVEYRLARLRELGLVENVGWKSMGRKRPLLPLYVWRIVGQVGRFDDGPAALRVPQVAQDRLAQAATHGGKRAGAGRPAGARDAAPRKRRRAQPDAACFAECFSDSASPCAASFLPGCNNQVTAQNQCKTSFTVYSLREQTAKEVARVRARVFSFSFKDLGERCRDNAELCAKQEAENVSWKLPRLSPRGLVPRTAPGNVRAVAGIGRIPTPAGEPRDARPVRARYTPPRDGECQRLWCEAVRRAGHTPGNFDAIGARMLFDEDELRPAPRAPGPLTDEEIQRELLGLGAGAHVLRPLGADDYTTPCDDEYGGQAARFGQFAEHLPYLTTVLRQLPRVTVPPPPQLDPAASDDETVRLLLEGYRMGVGAALGTRVWAYKTGKLPDTKAGRATRAKLLETARELCRWRVPPAFWAYWHQHRWMEADAPGGKSPKSGQTAAPLGWVFAPGRASDGAIDWFYNEMANGRERTIIFTPTADAIRETADRLWQDAARNARAGACPTVAEWREAVQAAFPFGLHAALAAAQREADLTHRRLTTAVRRGQWVWQQ